MNPRFRAVLQISVLILVIVSLIYFFPQVSDFVEMSARELRYFWWLILIVVLAFWLVFGLGRKRR